MLFASPGKSGKMPRYQRQIIRNKTKPTRERSMLKILDRVRKYIAIALLGLMAIIVVSATLEVAYEIVINMFEPPGFFIGVQDLFGVFGLFLMVLIGLELMTSIQMYLDHNSIHAELMLLVAITAITRKIVILDATQIDPMIMFGIGAVIIALALGYYLVRRSSVEKRATSTD
jgi:uncharacterized membrane protein (DUF373 family)